MALLAAEHLTFTYPAGARPALADMTVAFDPGSYTVVAGRSGCGKTTLLRALKTALAPAGTWSGTVRLDGVPLADVPLRDQARAVGFVMQEPDAQIVCESVEAELVFGLENLGCPREVMGLRVAEMAAFFGLQPLLHRRTDELSGGQKQLLNLAAVMALGPQVLVLDEPTSQLDPVAAVDFLAAVRRVNRELGTTIVMAEHRLEEALADADRFVVMDAGRIIAAGDPRTVARDLCAAGSPLVSALPAAVQVYAAVEGVGADAEGVGADAEGVAGSGEGPVPLTVREGRHWLQARCGESPGACDAFDADAEGDSDSRQVSRGPQGTVAEGFRLASAPADSPRRDSASALRLRDLWFRYGREGADVLRGLSLEVPAGRITALVGGNGSGKSTVLKAACGLVHPYRGTVEVLGHRLGPRRATRPAGAVLLPQDPTLLFSRATVREELEEMIAPAPASPGVPTPALTTAPEVAPGALAAMAECCDIASLLDAHPFDLSGGERQRVALAKVLLARPRLLLLDEPGTGADAAFKNALGTLLADLAREGVTVVMASHDLDFCARWADEAVLLFDGAVAAAAPPRELFATTGFYTTAASRLARAVFPGAVTVEDVVARCNEKGAPR